MAFQPAPIQGKPLNDLGFFTTPWVQWFSQSVYTSLATFQPSNTLPLMDSTLGAIGTALFYAREDHKHPSDTSKLGIGGTAADSSKLGGQVATYYLSTTGTAADSSKLGGVAATSYQQIGQLALSVSTPAAPAGTLSTVGVMMGLAGTITPVASTRALVTISGQMSNNTINDGATVQIRHGTGAAPANAAAMVGTAIGAAQTFTALVAAQKDGFSITVPLSGLTPLTAYWLDVSLAAVTGGTATLTGLTITAVEV